MKNITAAFLFCLTSTIAYAADPFYTQKPVVCSDVKTIVEFVSGGEFQEQPNWAGKDDKSKYVLMVNEKTKTWTMVQFNDQIACIIGAGTDANLINTKKIKSML